MTIRLRQYDWNGIYLHDNPNWLLKLETILHPPKKGVSPR
jgi:hypothetical protein